MDNEPAIIELRPRTDKDYRYIGINSKIKLPNPEVTKISKYLQKRLHLRLKDNEELAREIVRADCNQIKVVVELNG